MIITYGNINNTNSNEGVNIGNQDVKDDGNGHDMSNYNQNANGGNNHNVNNYNKNNCINNHNQNSSNADIRGADNHHH